MSIEAESSARRRGHDARLLADSLRTSRVTLLYGEGGVSRTDLLTDGVLPLLRRRAADGPTRSGRRARTAPPDTERRNVGAGRRRHAERAVLFNDWAGAPLAALEVSILSSLPMGVVVQAEHRRLSDLLAELCDRLDARFLIVLDAFERLWDGDSRDDAILDFIDQLSEAANRADLSANFLLSIDGSAASRLEALRRRIAGFDDSTLWLHAAPPQKNTQESGDPPSARGAVPPVLALADSLPGPAARPERTRRKRPPRQPLPPTVPIKTETVYAFIESTLTQTADASKPWQEAPEAVVVAEAASGGGGRPFKPPGSAARAVPRAGTSPRTTVPSLRPIDERVMPLIEPPSPIDQWLDAATAWCRRLFRLQPGRR